MFSVTGIYDGNKIYPTEPIKQKQKYKVIITFMEELDTDNKEDHLLREWGYGSAAFSFWESEKEDIYRDYLTTPHK